MKKIIKNITFLLAILLFVRCSDFLTEKPVSIIGSDSYYQTDVEFVTALNGVFYPLFSGWGIYDFNAIFLLTGGGEDITSRKTAPEYRQWDNFSATPTGPHANTMWNNSYGSINAANMLIDLAEKSTNISNANKASYIAQAKFIRALCYFNLVRFWGEIPIVTYENAVYAADLEQSSIADVYSVIVSDFQDAEANLPLTQTEKGRPTRGAAKAMLAKVYLTMAGWPLKQTDKYALARDKAKEVMDLGIYQLEPEFGELWLCKNKFTNKEFIFIMTGSGAVSATASHHHQAQRPQEESGWTDVCTEIRFLEAFPEGVRKDYSFWTVFANGTRWEESQEGQPYISKFRDAGVGATREQGAPTQANGDGFFPIVRYGDVLLMYAEAANKVEGSPSELAIKCVNDVRTRAGYLPLIEAGISQADFDAAVLAERNWELAFEGNRWFDLQRREMVEAANKDLYPHVSRKDYFFPKPATEMDIVTNLKDTDATKY